MIPANTHLKAYEERLILLNAPIKTRISYLSIFRKYLEYCNGQQIEDPFTDAVVKQYLLYRYSQKLDWKTINMDYSAIKKYFVDVLQIAWNTQMFPRPKSHQTTRPHSIHATNHDTRLTSQLSKSKNIWHHDKIKIRKNKNKYPRTHKRKWSNDKDFVPDSKSLTTNTG